MTKQLALTATLSHRYDSQPGDGREEERHAVRHRRLAALRLTLKKAPPRPAAFSLARGANALFQRLVAHPRRTRSHAPTHAEAQRPSAPASPGSGHGRRDVLRRRPRCRAGNRRRSGSVRRHRGHVVKMPSAIRLQAGGAMPGSASNVGVVRAGRRSVAQLHGILPTEAEVERDPPGRARFSVERRHHRRCVAVTVSAVRRSGPSSVSIRMPVGSGQEARHRPGKQVLRHRRR